MLELIKKTIYLIFIFFIGLFIGSSFFIRAKYNTYIYGDKPILQNQKLGIFILVIVLLILFSIVLYRLCLKINKYSKRRYYIRYFMLYFSHSNVGFSFLLPVFSVSNF